MNVGYQDRTAGAVEHCESMATGNAGGVIGEAYDTLAGFLKAKLWHQLTQQVLKVLGQPETYATTVDGAHSFLALYDKVVLPVDAKLNPLSLAKIGALVAQAIQPQDVTAAKAILENLLAKFKEQQEKNNTMNNSGANNAAASLNQAFAVPATIFVESKLSSLILETTATNATAEDFAPVLKTIQTNVDRLHEFPAEGNTELAAVHAAHYQSSMLYYKRLGPPEAFYEQALQYLQHKGPEFSTPSHPADVEAAHQLAVDLITAALTGDGVYNLGQVQQTPVLQLLLETPQAWLVHLLQATAAGNVQQFRNCQTEYAAQIAQQPALTARAAAVEEKLTLLALVTLVFSKPSQERMLTFEEIATALLLKDGVDQVEWIVMRALSVHLIEGSIDQVAQTVDVTWVMPRVLSAEQLQELAQRFGEWATKVSTTQDTSMNLAATGMMVA